MPGTAMAKDLVRRMARRSSLTAANPGGGFGAVLSAGALAVLFACGSPAFAAAADGAVEAISAMPPVAVDSGDEASAWTAIASPGATARIVSGRGRDGKAVGLAFDLGRGRTHAIARRALSVDLPADYMFVFTIRGDAEPNSIEIKFISGENVWWKRLDQYELPADWRELRISKPRISFAWGPAGGGMPAHLDALEVAVVAANGGKGELWIDGIRLVPRDPALTSRPPSATTSTNADAAPLLLDGKHDTVWRSGTGGGETTITLDFHDTLEQGGLVVDHADGGYASEYSVEASSDARQWSQVQHFARSDGGADYVYMPDVFARYVRLRIRPPAGREVAIAEIRPQEYEFSASPNGFFATIARAAAPGDYPRYFDGEQSYWTVVGAPGDLHEALVNEEGSVEVDAGGFTLEPFVWRGGELRTWKDAATSVSLDGGDLPIPSVERRDGTLRLTVTAFAAGEAGASTLYVRYRLASEVAADARLFVALRPFQVLPPWQTLNRTGGVATLRHIERDGRTIRADDRRVVALEEPTAFGAAAFEEGAIASLLRRGFVPPNASAEDGFGYASAALAWDVRLEAGATRDVWIAVPWSKSSPVEKDAAAALERTRERWKGLVERVTIELPGQARDWVDSLRSNLAYILINRDGAAIQPGSRTYERSWIRDGAMTSGALLELGLDREVQEFLRWYAGFIGEDGWVPCCVDARGADPTPEHDSFGEFVWAVAEVWRFTRDESFVREMWPKVRAVAGRIQRLRETRMTPEYEAADKRAFYGLLPESISHEGYSARPVHSYWDQAFALRGLADAALLAGVVGDEAAARRIAAQRDELEKNLTDSIRHTMEANGLDVVPASVELGDFDPTSTAVSFLLGTDGVYPRDALGRSFDKYVADLRARRGLETRGVGYTAYELRSATALVLLGRKQEAVEMLGQLVADQRPLAWNQWPEISWYWKGEPSFLGDLPHTWIGSTFVHAVRTLLVAEREETLAGTGTRLVVGAGVPLRWLDEGEVRARSLPTWFGAISLRIAKPRGAEGDAHRAVVELVAARPPDGRPPSRTVGGPDAPSFTMPDGGIEVAAPFGGEVVSAKVDGVPTPVERCSVRLRRLPANVVFQYKPALENPREQRERLPVR